MALMAMSGLTSSMTAQGSPTLLRHVNGYTLSGDHLVQFETLAFDQGRVLEVGDEAALTRKYPDATQIDGHGRTLLPGLIDAHGHVLDLGIKATQIELTRTRASLTRSTNPGLCSGQSWKSLALGDGWNQEVETRAVPARQ